MEQDEPYQHIELQSIDTPLLPGRLHIGGFWGECLAKNMENWLLHVSDDLLLSGFRQKPGIQAFIGEHIGKYLLGSIPASLLLHSDRLEEKNRFLVESLVAMQEPDGYLGTYPADRRWFGLRDDKARGGTVDLKGDVWDVWVHKYCILALLMYYQFYGWEPALVSAIKAADLILRVFGPGGRDINQCDYPAGLASGSFMEPLMRLFQVTGYPRYLDFARHMLKGWQDPTGPRLLTILKEAGDVVTIGDGKAYEMMSCFVGLVEYARATGDRQILHLVCQARDQIADAHRYVTGGMSTTEYFWRAGLFPEWASMETCVTFTWIQLNLRIYELTGDPRSLDLVEESAWNQLLPAFSPQGDTLTYHVSLVGPKRFFHKWVVGIFSDNDFVQGAPISCCHTNGQRGLVLVPLYAYTTKQDGTLAVNFYGPSKALIELPGVGPIEVEQQTAFPAAGDVEFTFTPQFDHPYQVQFRVPAWADQMQVGQQVVPEGARTFRVELTGKQSVQIHFQLSPRIIFSGFEGRGKCAVACGPLIFALDKPPDHLSLDSVVLNLGRGDFRPRLHLQYADGWPVIRVPACRIPAQATFGPTSEPIGPIDLIPVLFAGLKDNPGLTESLDGTNQEFINREKLPITVFPEYRVLLPFFWSPD